MARQIAMTGLARSARALSDSFGPKERIYITFSIFFSSVASKTLVFSGPPTPVDLTEVSIVRGP